MKLIGKNILIVFAGMACLSACVNDNELTQQTMVGEGLTVSIANDEAATRTIVIDNPGIQLDSYWRGDDELGVFGSQTNNSHFKILASTLSDDGRTASFNSADGIPSGSLVAYYPYMSGATYSSDKLNLSFPSVQHYTTVGMVNQPDPAACVMVGRGSQLGGIAMRNVMAVIKVGQVFDNATTVKSVEFRDLSGKAVCGDYSVDMSGDVPTTTFTGTGNVLTLDMGQDGVKASAGSTLIVFLVVPARNYPKGFEVTFVSADGTRTVKTAGTKRGKMLNRSVVHPVGDITSYSQIEGISYELRPEAQIMTPEKLDLISINRVYKDFTYDADGQEVKNEYGEGYRTPCMELVVHKDMNPKVGGWLIFNIPSTQLPQGGVFRIKQCTPTADGERFNVVAVSETNFAAPFESLQIGREPTFDADSNIVDDGGIEIDIAPFVKEIIQKDEDGNVVTRTPVNMHSNYVMNAAEGMTRAPEYKSFDIPQITISMDDTKHCTCDVSAKIKIRTRMAVGVFNRELQYVYYSLNPSVEYKTTFGLYGKFEKDKRFPIWDFYVTGIPIGPIVLIPEIGFTGFLGIGGETKFTASTTFNYDLGTFGVIYNKGQGLSCRKQKASPPEPNESFAPKFDSEITASFYAYGGIGIKAGISIYAMCSLGLNTDVKLTFGRKYGVSHSGNVQPEILHLTPEIDIAPYSAFVGGKWIKVFKGLMGKIEFEPIWQRYERPMIFAQYIQTFMNYLPADKYANLVIGDSSLLSNALGNIMPIGVDHVNWAITLRGKTINNYIAALEVYQGSDAEFKPGFLGPYPYGMLETFRSSGLIHLAPLFVKCDFRIVQPRLVQRIEVGVHQAGQDSTVLGGTLNQLDISQGGPYLFTFNVYDIPKDIEFDGDHSGWLHESSPHIDYCWYYWPYNANGGEYEWRDVKYEEDEDEEEE